MRILDDYAAKPTCKYCGGSAQIPTQVHSMGCTAEHCEPTCPEQDWTVCWCTKDVQDMNEVYWAVKKVLDTELWDAYY